MQDCYARVVTSCKVAGMNRRDMIKLSATGSMAALTSAVSTDVLAATKRASASQATVPQWEMFEITLDGPATGNPYVDTQLTAIFSLDHRTLQIDGFYDGEGKYKLRFMPDTLGDWSYITDSNVPALAGKTGRLTCIAPLAGVHGPVQVRNTHHFAYADGTPYFPFGTTSYAWVHEPEELQEQTLETLRASSFNKIRMCVFPKSYEYVHNEPPMYPFERDASGVSDFAKFNPAYFAHLEKRIGDLRELNIESDLIVFHPYDRWGYSRMPAEADDRYLKYVLARFSAYRNIWWSLGNEFDLMRAKSVQDFDRFFHIVETHDAFSHLRSIHSGKTRYDYSKPWVTHACMQTSQLEAATWLEAFRKPLVFDEVGYEGNLNRRWGTLSGEEMLHYVWLGVIAGCYVTHGETLLDEDAEMSEDTTPLLWWARGGKLKGTSPARIFFLRKLVEETATAGGPSSKRTGLTASADDYYSSATATDDTGKKVLRILYYMSTHQPLWYEFPLPEGEFTAEFIDTWEMTITPVPGKFSGKTKLRLPVKISQALRFTRIDA